MITLTLTDRVAYAIEALRFDIGSSEFAKLTDEKLFQELWERDDNLKSVPQDSVMEVIARYRKGFVI